MPVISMFFGIIIYMNWDEHLPPHFHARYQDFNGMFTFDGDPLEGNIPPKQRKLIAAWAELHHDELLANWEVAREHEELFRIDPLR